jgi:hypothetical protein
VALFAVHRGVLRPLSLLSLLLLLLLLLLMLLMLLRAHGCGKYWSAAAAAAESQTDRVKSFFF